MSEYITVWKDHEPTKLRWNVPVVRCEDCKYYEAVPEDSGDWCGYWTGRVYADVRGSGFCAWGVKEES